MHQTIERRHSLLAAAALFFVAVATVFGLERFFVATAHGQRLDDSAMRTVSAGSMALQHLHSYLGNITVGTTAVVLTACVVFALLRRRFAIAAGAIAIVAGADVTTQFLKKAYFGRPDFGLLTINSFPSGHTTVAISAVLAAVLVAPPLLRPLIVALGSFAATLVGASTIVGGWHRPSDVLGALAVALVWGTAVAMVVGTVDQPQAEGLGRSILLALSGAAAAGILLVAVGVRPTNGVAGLFEAVGILGLVGIATALTIGLFARMIPR